MVLLPDLYANLGLEDLIEFIQGQLDLMQSLIPIDSFSAEFVPSIC